MITIRKHLFLVAFVFIPFISSCFAPEYVKKEYERLLREYTPGATDFLRLPESDRQLIRKQLLEAAISHASYEIEVLEEIYESGDLDNPDIPEHVATIRTVTQGILSVTAGERRSLDNHHDSSSQQQSGEEWPSVELSVPRLADVHQEDSHLVKTWPAFRYWWYDTCRSVRGFEFSFGWRCWLPFYSIPETFILGVIDMVMGWEIVGPLDGTYHQQALEIIERVNAVLRGKETIESHPSDNRANYQISMSYALGGNEERLNFYHHVVMEDKSLPGVKEGNWGNAFGGERFEFVSDRSFQGIWNELLLKIRGIRQNNKVGYVLREAFAIENRKEGLMEVRATADVYIPPVAFKAFMDEVFGEGSHSMGSMDIYSEGNYGYSSFFNIEAHPSHQEDDNVISAEELENLDRRLQDEFPERE